MVKKVDLSKYSEFNPYRRYRANADDKYRAMVNAITRARAKGKLPDNDPDFWNKKLTKMGKRIIEKGKSKATVKVKELKNKTSNKRVAENFNKEYKELRGVLSKTTKGEFGKRVQNPYYDAGVIHSMLGSSRWDEAYLDVFVKEELDGSLAGDPVTAYVSPTANKGIKFEKLNEAIKKVLKQNEDTTPLLQFIAADFFGTNKRFIFSQRGPGGMPYFKDLDPRYKAAKIAGRGGNFRKQMGGVSNIEIESASLYGEGAYPILVNTGKLEHSLTTVGQNPSTVYQIVGNRSLVVGTAISYAEHNVELGRNPVQLDPPRSNRLKFWLNNAERYILQGTKGLKSRVGNVGNVFAYNGMAVTETASVKQKYMSSPVKSYNIKTGRGM
jgi:hypothetical protein